MAPTLLLGADFYHLSVVKRRVRAVFKHKPESRSSFWQRKELRLQQPPQLSQILRTRQNLIRPTSSTPRPGSPPKWPGKMRTGVFPASLPKPASACEKPHSPNHRPVPCTLLYHPEAETGHAAVQAVPVWAPCHCGGGRNRAGYSTRG